MPHLHPHIDPQGLDEFSVVFTDRSLNHMSQRFQQVMRDLSATLREVYSAHQVAIVPGGGTYAMEAVARQFGTGHALIVRNGWFSYRWSQIFDTGGFARETTVVMARPAGNEPRHPSQLYEAGLEGLLLFVVLSLAIWKWRMLKRPGFVTGLFLLGYGVCRAALENVRQPDAGLENLPLGLTMGMILSIPMMLVGAWLIWRALKKPEVAEA